MATFSQRRGTIKAVAKLYREPKNAQRAIDELKSQGFADQEIGLLFKPEVLAIKAKGRTHSLSLPEVGRCHAVGPLAQINAEEPLKALSQLLDLDEEAVTYYQFGLALGAVLITVHGEEARLTQASRILKAADSWPTGEPASPAFALSSYMTNSNPIDAKMTGDFRRY